MIHSALTIRCAASAFLLTVAIAMAIGPVRAEETTDVKAADITLKVPTSWKQQPPENRLRLAQFAIPAAEGEKNPGELSVFNFGSGGTVEQQVARWINQFQPDGRKIEARRGKVANLGEYVVVDLAGTYNQPDGPPILRRTVPVPDSRMLVAMIQTDNGDYFLKLVGGKQTIAGAADAFRAMFGADRESEKPLELPE